MSDHYVVVAPGSETELRNLLDGVPPFNVSVITHGGEGSSRGGRVFELTCVQVLDDDPLSVEATDRYTREELRLFIKGGRVKLEIVNE